MALNKYYGIKCNHNNLHNNTVKYLTSTDCNYTIGIDPVVVIKNSDINFIICENKAEVTVTQYYFNESDKLIECSYTFPLEEGSAICSFEADINGKIIIGKCIEKTKAFQLYDDAIAQGHGASMIESCSDDIFKVTLGNVPGKANIKIKFIYVISLQSSLIENKIIGTRFYLPSVIAPRYGKFNVLNNIDFLVSSALQNASEIFLLKVSKLTAKNSCLL